MFEEDKQRIYKETREALLELSKEELKKVSNTIYLTNGIVAGSIVSMIVFGSLNPDFFYAAPATATVLALIANILSRIKKKNIISKADRVAKQMTDDMMGFTELMNGILPMVFGGIPFGSMGPDGAPFVMPVGIKIRVRDVEEMPVEADYEVLDENGLSLADKCNLLISYATDVAYPGYEEDVQCLEEILKVLTSGYQSVNTSEYNLVINQLEFEMLDKAYKFYTGDFAR